MHDRVVDSRLRSVNAASAASKRPQKRAGAVITEVRGAESALRTGVGAVVHGDAGGPRLESKGWGGRMAI